MKIFAAVALCALAGGLSGCVPIPADNDCGGGACGCPVPACADVYTSVLDNGKAFNLEVGNSIDGTLPGSSTGIHAHSSDSAVLRQVGGIVDGKAGFSAVQPGVARLDFGYTNCSSISGAGPCSYVVYVRVVRLPTNQVMIDQAWSVFDDSGRRLVSARLQAGASLTIKLTKGFFNTAADYYRFMIATPNIVEWVFAPALFPSWFEGSIKALQLGTAKILIDGCYPEQGNVCARLIDIVVTVTK